MAAVQATRSLKKCLRFIRRCPVSGHDSTRSVRLPGLPDLRNSRQRTYPSFQGTPGQRGPEKALSGGSTGLQTGVRGQATGNCPVRRQRGVRQPVSRLKIPAGKGRFSLGEVLRPRLARILVEEKLKNRFSSSYAMKTHRTTSPGLPCPAGAVAAGLSPVALLSPLQAQSPPAPPVAPTATPPPPPAGQR
jgi:hypothetical protein